MSLFYFSGSGSVGAGWLGSASVSVQSCDNDWFIDRYSVGEYQNCTDLVALAGKAEGLVSIPFSGHAKSFYGDCNKSSCVGYSVGHVTVNPVLEFEITIGGFFATSFSVSESIKLSDPFSSGGCN